MTDPETTSSDTSRRGFLIFLIGGSSLVAAIALGIPVIGFLLAPLLRKAPAVWRSVGGIHQFDIGKIVEISIEDVSTVPWSGQTAATGAWLYRQSENRFVVYSLNCTHLGCPVRWEPDAELFMCPCHGGVYYRDGSVAAGPPPKPLQQYPVRVREGTVEIQASPIPIT